MIRHARKLGDNNDGQRRRPQHEEAGNGKHDEGDACGEQHTPTPHFIGQRARAEDDEQICNERDVGGQLRLGRLH